MPSRSATCPLCHAALLLTNDASEFCSECGAVLPEATSAGEPRWFFVENKRKAGPIALKELRQRVADGRLRPEDLLLQEGTTQWRPADVVPGLFDPLAPLTVTGPPPVSPPPVSPTRKRGEAEVLPTTGIYETHGSSGPTEAASPTVAIPGYEILGELGRGGMGVVYKAKHLKLNRLVALKMILAGSHAGPDQLNRFVSEARAVARLQHPNIVQVFEIGEHNQLPFFSLEYIEGGSLDKQLAGTPLVPRAAAELAESLARAMHYAHQHGIIHRDLKPANILLVSAFPLAVSRSEAGAKPQAEMHSPLTTHQPKITDFGLAKTLDTDSHQTRSGAIMGTPSYMAPEQALGKTQAIGPAADIYALGAMLYEFLTGRPPFKGTTPMDTIQQVVNEEPAAPSRLNPKTPRDLETICLKCLRKEPGQRYGSALDLANELRRFLNGEPIQARPLGRAERMWRWAKRKPALATAIAVSTLAAVILVVLGGTLRVLSTIKSAHTEAEHQRKIANEEREKAEAAERRAKGYLAQQSLDRAVGLDDPAHALLWLARARHDAEASGDRQVLLASINSLAGCQASRVLPCRLVCAGSPSFSADGRLLATSDGKETRVRETATGKPVGPVLQAENSVFSADGRRLATSDQKETRLWETATGKQVGPVLQGRASALNADGRLLATSDGKETRVRETATGKPVGPVLQGQCIGFRADGRLLATHDKGKQTWLWETATGKQVGPALQGCNHGLSADGRLVATSDHKQTWLRETATGKQIGPALQGGVWAAFSTDGRRLATCDQKQTWLWETAAGKQVGPVLQGGSPALSADGRLLATHGHKGTWLWETATGQPVGPALPGRPRAFSADGRLLATTDDKQTWLWETAMGQSFGLVLQGSSPAVSMDGRLLATTDQKQTWLWETATGKQVGPVLQGFRPAFSTDGRRLATSDGKQTWLWETATGKQVGPVLQGSHPVFSADGRLLATRDAKQTRLWEMATGKQVGPVLQGSYAVSFSADGQLLATTDQKQTWLWETATGKQVGPVLQGSYRVFSADGRRLATHDDKGKQTWLWETATGKQVGPVLQGFRPALSADGRLLATSDYKQTWLWETATGKQVGPVRQGSYPALSADGRLLATSDYKQTWLWETATGKQVGPVLQGRPHAFSADGRLLATYDDKQTWLWETATGKQVGPALQGSSPRFSADGRLLATHDDKQTWLHPVPRPCPPCSLERFQLWIEVLTAQELTDADAIKPLSAAEWQKRRAALEKLGGPLVP